MKILEHIWRYFNLRPSGPETLMSLAAARRKMPTSKLYVVEVCFAATDQDYVKMHAYLDQFRQKFGLDFLLLEPGYKLKRFDDY